MNTYTTPFALFLLLLAGIISPTHAQEGLKAPVVRIQSGEDYLMETGAGVLAGTQANELFILTAAHVIPDPANILVQFTDGKQMKAQLLESNTGLDIAVITCRIPPNFQAPSSFALSKADKQILQSVIVIGHPQGNDWDINFNTNLKSLEHDLDDRLFTLAPIGIGPGNSGGPVLNQAYELMGLVQEIDPVKAVCVDIETLLKACTAWKVPTNLLVGVTLQQEEAEVSGEEVRLQLILQEANTAFSAKKWRQAKRAYTEAHSLNPSSQYTRKIQHCELQIAKDEAYAKYLKQGKAAPDLQTAYNHYLRAQENRDTEEIRELVQKTKERLAVFDINVSKNSRGGPLPETFSDPLAGEFVLIKGGTFTMGCDTCDADNWPAHQVYVDDFYMARKEVTEQLFLQYLNEVYHQQEYYSTHFKSELKGRRWTYKAWDSSSNPRYHSDEYYEIYHFISWLSEKTGHVFRLPTEAEWEYAALVSHLQSKSPLTNMIEEYPGEWTSDLYHPDTYQADKAKGTVSNPKGATISNSRVFRGKENLKKRRKDEDGHLRLVKVPHAVHSGKPLLPNFIEDNMVFVQGGSFKMGSREGNEDNRPLHQVHLDDFYLSSVKVTPDQWSFIMGNEVEVDITERDSSDPIGLGWESTQLFINKLNSLTGMNYRLPTEAEWEYVARQGLQDKGSQNKKDDSEQSNALGIYQLGYYKEWCNDWYHSDYYSHSQADNPLGPASGLSKVVRFLYDDKPQKTLYLRKSDFTDTYIGFRLVRSADGSIPNPVFEDPFESEMVFIPGGTYAEEKLPDFKLSKYEVSQEQWNKIVGYLPEDNPDCPTCPVSNATYHEIMAFIKALNAVSKQQYRLPWKNEWEYAAIGGKNGTVTTFVSTNKRTELHKYGNHTNDRSVYSLFERLKFRNDKFKGLAPRGSFLPNSIGLYDLSGNVGEMCHHIGEDGDVIYVVKGGSYASWVYSQSITSTTVFSKYAYRDGTVRSGFRLAADIK